MPKLTGPALNIRTSGALGHDAIYSDTRAGAIGKSYAQPTNPRSPAQVRSRNVFRNISDLTRIAPPTWRAVLEEQARNAKQPINNALVGWNMAQWKAGASDYPLVATRNHNLPAAQSSISAVATSGDIAATFANPQIGAGLMDPVSTYLLMPIQDPTIDVLAQPIWATKTGTPTTAHLAPPLPSTVYQVIGFASGKDIHGRPAWTQSATELVTSAVIHYPTTTLTAATNEAAPFGTDYARVAYNTITEDDNGWSGIAGNTINPNAPGTYSISATWELWAPFGAVTALCAIHMQNGTGHTHNFAVTRSLASGATATFTMTGNLVATSSTVQFYPEVWNQGAASFVYVKEFSFLTVSKIA